MARRFAPLLMLFVVLAITFLAYQRGLTGAFVLDDGAVIVNNTYLNVPDLGSDSLKQAALSNASGPLMRPVTMLTFAFNYYATGLNPFHFKLTNVVIHLLNGVGIFALTCLLLSAYRKTFQPRLSPRYASWLSLAVAAAWLLHPFNLTGVLYTVQRMTSLATFFSIWGLALFLWGRMRLFDSRKGILAILVSATIFTPLAVLSKENGALLPVFMLVIEITLLNFRAVTPAARHFLIAFYIFFVAIPVAAVLIYIAWNPWWLTIGYEKRDFTLLERALTEARVIWFYIRQIVVPSTSQMALFHDDIAISRGLFVPMTTAASLFGILAALVVAVAVRKKAPIAAFGILFFFAGHVLESTVFPFEIAYEHRNYFPMYGILLALFFCILYPLSYLQNLRMRQAAAFLLIGLFAAGTFSRASAWADPLSFNQAEVEHHPDSPRANSEMGDTYSSLNSEDFFQREMYYFSAAQHYERATQLDKNTTQGLFGLILLNSTREKPVEARWVRDLVYRLEHQRNPDHSYKLNNLIACQAEGRCKLPEKVLEDIVVAPLRNPAVKGQHLANAYTTRNLYLGNIVDDFPGALDALYRAIDAAPSDLHYRLNLINFLMIKGRFDEARQELDKVKQIDKSPTNRAKIESLSKVLAMHG